MTQTVSASELRRIVREFDQVSVASSIMGTSRRKLEEMARMGRRVARALVGERKEVALVRAALVRSLHNMERGRIDQTAAFRMETVRDLLKRVQKLSAKGLGLVPEETRMERMPVTNSYGYSEKEMRDISRKVREVSVMLDDVGLFRKLVKGDVVLRPEMPEFASYDHRLDVLLINGDGKRPKGSLARAYAMKMWRVVFGDAERRVWGSGGSAMNRFADTFEAMMSGKVTNDIDFARLLITAGRIGDAGQMKARVRSRKLTKAS